MSDLRPVPDGDFAPAPLGGRVRLITWLTAASVVVVDATVAVVLLQERHPPPWPVWPAMFIAPVLVGAIWYGALIRRYRLGNDEIVIERAWLTMRLPLAGLTAVESDREALQGAMKIMGNDGLGAWAGRFRSKKLGKFRAYVSDPDCAVVLRWPDRCLVLSPAEPGEFTEAVRARLAGRD
ncbi:MAG TPA: PH domain-containing protein [Opitutaceae bacterium]|nr:PH domain-containing protein [Opitutaceae bacterium]